MKVTLISYTFDADFIAAIAAKVCYSNNSIEKIKMDEQSKSNILKRVIKSGHLSVIEHASFTYALEGISRIATHQLVRHRLASYSQQSHRYTKIKQNSFIIPPSIEDNKDALDLYENSIKNNLEIYNKLIEMGIKKEDARFVIPQGVSSSIIVTMNARELMHFFTLRCCVRAQWEIRNAAIEMLKLAKTKAPVIFENAGPACVRGKCPEEKPCNNIPEIRKFFKNL